MASPSSVITEGEIFTPSLMITDGFGSSGAPPVGTAREDKFVIGETHGTSINTTQTNIGGFGT